MTHQADLISTSYAGVNGLDTGDQEIWTPETDLLKIAENITTPLMLAALVVLVLFASLRAKISEQRSRQLFILALVAIVLGVVADTTGKRLRRPLLHGRVYSPPNDITQGIGHADVVVRYDSGGENAVCTDPAGEFEIEIPSSELNRGATVWAVAEMYSHSEPKPIKLVADVDVLIPLELQPAARTPRVARMVRPPLPDSGGAPVSQPPDQDPNCLAGTWRESLTGRSEEPPGALEWTASVSGGTLKIARQDNLVAGEFTKNASVWIGKLRWRNGGTWSNVILTPAPDCRQIRTNQFWSYTKVR